MFLNYFGKERKDLDAPKLVNGFSFYVDLCVVVFYAYELPFYDVCAFYRMA